MGSKRSISQTSSRALAALRAAVVALPGGIPLGALCPTRGSLFGLTRIDLVPQAAAPRYGDVWNLALRALGERYRAEARVVLVRKRRVYVRFIRAPRLVDEAGQDRVPLGEALLFCRFNREEGRVPMLFGLRADLEMPVAALRVAGVDLELWGIQVADAEILDAVPRNVELALRHASGFEADVSVPMTLSAYRIEEATQTGGEASRYKAFVQLDRVQGVGEAAKDWEEFLAAVQFGGLVKGGAPQAALPAAQVSA